MAIPDPGDRPPTTRTPILSSFFIVLMFLAMIAFFIWPWLPNEDPVLAEVERLLPLRNGQSTLLAVRNAEGDLIGWESRNVEWLPVVPTLAKMDTAELDNLILLYGAEAFVSNIDIQLVNDRVSFLEVAARRVDLEGHLTRQGVDFVLRSVHGDYRLSRRGDVGEPIQALTPIQLVDGAQLPAGGIQERGETEDDVFESDVTWTPLSEVTIDNRLFLDCIRLTHRIAFESGSEFETEQISCAEIGLVEEKRFRDGALYETLVTISGTDFGPPLDPSWPAVALAAPVIPEPLDIEALELEFWTEIDDLIASTEASFPPTFVPAEEPFILAAQVQGRVEAISVETAERLWAFQTEGTVFGGVLVDGERGRLYFGSSDKRLYAVDFNGLFLWSIQTSDNVVTRPIVEGDRVLFGSEDRTIYCADAHGGVFGKVETNGPLTAWPVSNGVLALFGSDDGGVYAVRLEDCGLEWIFDAGNGVEAAILIDPEEPDIAYVTGREQVVALEFATGEAIWAFESEEVLRLTPALGEDRLYLVDGAAELLAIDRGSGRLLWKNGDDDYLGSPLLLEESPLVVGLNEGLYLYDPDGNRTREWVLDLPSSGPLDQPADYMFGPQRGRSAVWLIDDQTRLIRLVEAE